MEVSSPSTSMEAGPRLRERPLGRCHTLDPGGWTPEPAPTGHGHTAEACAETYGDSHTTSAPSTGSPGEHTHAGVEAQQEESSEDAGSNPADLDPVEGSDRRERDQTSERRAGSPVVEVS